MMPQLRTLACLPFALVVACASGAEPHADNARSADSAGGEESVGAAGVGPAGRAEGEKPASSAKVGDESAAERRAPRSEFDTPLQDCQIESDYNECVVERLEGRTRSEKELMALIQSQRMIGEVDAAKRNIEKFLERYPDSPMVDSYRQYLETR